MSILSEKFSMADLVKASAVNEQTIKSYLHKGFVLGNHPTAKIEGGGGRGQRRRFSFHTLMEIALANEIGQLGFGTRDMEACFEVARQFAHVSGGGEVLGLPMRLPGLPFHHNNGDTIFGIAGTKTVEELFDPNSDRDTYRKLRIRLRAKHFMAINATTVFMQVCDRLDVHGFEVLDAEYPAEATA